MPRCFQDTFINVGIILLRAENACSGNVYRWFMRNAEIPRALQSTGLVKYTVRSKTQLRQ